TGLVLLSDDGQWSHRITAPGKSCYKTYRIESRTPLSAEDLARLEKGLLLDGETRPTLPARIRDLGGNSYELDLREGRFHQVKRMLEAVENGVLDLHRLSIGGIVLDDSLAPGCWRELSTAEVLIFAASHPDGDLPSCPD
ncbi:MAG: 16S rRNA pseudouridine(516) synthase, partial [Planctomycetes bacterium]|nr:16S rRNA pseudouridine(516) synthase [Planctomycetota bacterium]